MGENAHAGNVADNAVAVGSTTTGGVTKVMINNLSEFDSYTEKLKPDGPPVLFYFTGSKLPNGKSWCPDCNDAEPVVDAFLKDLKKEIIFAHVDVGDRDYWKNPSCPFRTDKRMKLMVIPTLMKWKGVQRLEGSQCTKRELLDMLFEEE